MVDLVLRPSGLDEKHNKPWALQLRYAGIPSTSYQTVTHVSDEIARQIIEAGEPFWLFGEPDWTDRERPKARERARVLRDQADAIEAQHQPGPEPAASSTPEPIPMVLHCPNCRTQHIDKPDHKTGWTNPPHRSHECQECGFTWRPADVPTTGVEAIATQGKRDGRCEHPKLTTAQRRLAQSDADSDLLTRALAMADGHEPIGNVNYGNILEALRYGWIDGRGITPAGRAAIEAATSPKRRRAG